ncbi:uncharacterized protein [Anoplolepis gracilipes]|uniref:uncharacterized protein n=1 Tax=Anoplolepis gracilipes TaxID=354296 RepID=UPI003BA3A5E8
MAIKLRHSFTYSAAEDILRLLNMTDSNSIFTSFLKIFVTIVSRVMGSTLRITILCPDTRGMPC